MGDDKDYQYDITYDTLTDTNTSSDFGTTITFNTDYSSTDETFTINLNEIDQSWQTVATPEYRDFVDTMPSVQRVDAMCEEYPALKKAYEQFKLIYKMTEQDYKGKLASGELDDEIPF